MTCRRVLGRCRGWPLCAAALWVALAPAAAAQERPYFINYSRHLEEPDSLEISLNPVFATQRGGGDFLGGWLELEYGVKGWWTTELYLDAQGTRRDSAVLTGWRWENRVRPLLHEHWINPVLYLEYEDIDGADKTMLEVVGHDVESDHAPPNRELRREHKRELEAKLILGSSLADWDLSENFIAEKNLAGAPWEFGYAVGFSRPLALPARPEPCSFCPENFTAGVEMYGSLGDATGFGLKDTSHYLAALVAWNLPGGTTLRLSPAWGLNRSSHRFLLRFGVSYEIPGLWRRESRRQAARAELP